MTPDQANQLANVYAAIFTGGPSLGPTSTAVPPEHRIPSDTQFGNSIGSRLQYIQWLAQNGAPATITDEQVIELANALAPQIPAGATPDQVKAIVNGTKLVSA